MNSGTPPRHIALDTETSGLSAADELTSFYAVEFDIRSGALGQALQLDFNPVVPISHFATQKTGQTNAGQAKYPIISKTHCLDIAKFLKGGDVWIHNKPFDERFIDKAMRRFGLAPVSSVSNLFCSIQRARAVGHKDCKLDTLCDHYRIDRSSRSVHGARVDAELLAMVVSKMYPGAASTKSTAGIRPSNPDPRVTAVRSDFSSLANLVRARRT